MLKMIKGNDLVPGMNVAGLSGKGFIISYDAGNMKDEKAIANQKIFDDLMKREFIRVDSSRGGYTMYYLTDKGQSYLNRLNTFFPIEIFLSYSRADSDLALSIWDSLKKNDFKLWVDQKDIMKGQRWDTTIEYALNESSIFLVIVSEHSLKSNYVLDEISFALDEGKTIIPLLKDEVKLPLRLRRFQHINFINDYTKAINELEIQLNIELRKIPDNSQ